MNLKNIDTITFDEYTESVSELMLKKKAMGCGMYPLMYAKEFLKRMGWDSANGYIEAIKAIGMIMDKTSLEAGRYCADMEIRFRANQIFLRECNKAGARAVKERMKHKNWLNQFHLHPNHLHPDVSKSVIEYRPDILIITNEEYDRKSAEDSIRTANMACYTNELPFDRVEY